MENLTESPQGKRAAGSAAAGAEGSRTEAAEREDVASSIWEELRARRAKASRRIGEGWERVSENARDYADDHAMGVALGSLAVGLALGALLGVLIARD